MTPMKQRAGLVLDVRVGEAIYLKSAGLDSEKIVLTLEAKDGKKARVRIQASQSVKVGRLDKSGA